MSKYKLSDSFYTIIGILVVLGGITIFLLTSGILDKEENLENNEPNTNGEVTDSPVVEENPIPEPDTTPDNTTTTPTEKEPVKDNSANTDKDTTNNSQNNTTNGNTSTDQGTTSTSDVLSCSMTSEESGVKTVNVCDNVFVSGYLSTQTCVATITSSDKTVLDQQYQFMKFAAEAFDIGDATAMNSKVTYDNNKVVLTQFTDLKKAEAILAKGDGTITIDVSSTNTKVDVNKILTTQGYTCK